MDEIKHVEYWVQQATQDRWHNVMSFSTDIVAIDEANYLNRETKSDTFRAVKRTITEEVL